MNKLHSEYLLMKSLQHKYIDKITYNPILEHALTSEEGINLPLKNLCAKVSESLVNEVDKVCEILSISKREFVEIAVSMLIQEFYEIAKKHEIFDESDFKAFKEFKSFGDSQNQEELPL